VKQKGAAIRSTLGAIDALHGPEVAKRIRRALPDEIRTQLEPVTLAAAWYPVEVTAAIHVAIRDVIGRGDWGASHAIGVEAAKSDFSSVHRAFLRASDFDTIWDRGQAAWSRYNSQGEARFVDREKGSATAIVEGVEGFNLGIWNAVAGRCEAMIRMAGAPGAFAEVADATTSRCKLRLIWVP
jgi:hypothetical protein